MTLLLPKTKVLLSTGRYKNVEDLQPNIDQVSTPLGPITVQSVSKVTQDAIVCTIESGRHSIVLHEDTKLYIRNKDTRKGYDCVRACLLDGSDKHYGVTKLDKEYNFKSTCEEKCLVTFIDVELDTDCPDCDARVCANRFFLISV